MTVSPAGTVAFRYDYRLNGRRETLTIGRYDPTLKETRQPSELAYGMSLSLAKVRALLVVARRSVEACVSPSRAEVEKRTEAAAAPTFGVWTQKDSEFKADRKSGEERLAESTLVMLKSIYKRALAAGFGVL